MADGFDGSHTTPLLPFNNLTAGADLGSAFFVPPGGNVFYVRGNGTATTEYDNDPAGIRGQLHASVQVALNSTVANRGDVILVFPGHTESISAADGWSNLKAGTRIIGMGTGNSRPVITWTAATSTVLMDVANVSVQNIIMQWAGDPASTTALTVAAPITVSAAGCSIKGCRINAGVDADQLVTIGLTTTAAADDFTVQGNQLHSATTAEATTFMQFVGADRLQFHGNQIVGATSAVAVGCIRFLTTASTNIKMFGNTVRNNKAASEQAITGMAAMSGEVDHLFMTVLSNAAGALTGAFSTPADVTFGRQCYVANTIGERAALFGTESA
jgi:hypothetical protein